MKKKRSIIIKDPHLRKIRNNFRALILKASSLIEHKIMDEMEALKDDVNEFFNSPDLMKKNKKLERRLQEIDRQLYASILLCPACFQSDKDMTYNPVRKEWYCTECYAELKKSFTEEGRPEEFP